MNRQGRRWPGARNDGFELARLNHLPLSVRYVNHVSLANHLALETACVMEGNKDALNRMSSVLYLCYLIWEGAGRPDLADDFLDAEAALDAAVRRASGSGIWRLELADRGVLARLLLIHDEQLASISTRTYLRAAERLDRLLLSKDPVSPLAGLSAAQDRSGRSTGCAR